jgi:hypothetical protein
VIPFLLILGALYLLSAPDPVTAGARTAAGTGARAAASGFGQHWADGRKYRDGRRTARRERWDGRVNGAKPHPWLLRADRAITWLLGADRTAAGITAAAARPVPAAMRGGWSRGWERHRAKAGNRPVPVALDLPRWRREQAQVQAGNRPQVQPAEQVQADVRRARGPGWWNRPDKSTSAASTPSGATEPIEPKEQSPVLAWQEIPFETVDDTTTDPSGGTCSGTARGLDLANPRWLTGPGGNRAAGTAQEQGGGQVQGGPQERAAIEIGKSYSRCSRCLGNVTDYATAEACDGCGARFAELRPDYAEHVEQIKSERSDLPVVGPQSRSPHRAPEPPTTEGAAMPAVPTELRTHVAVQDFAQQIDSMSESSDFIVAAEKARTIGEQSRAGGFGGEMDLATDALEETARRFAQSVDALREQAHELAKTSLSVQGS